MASFRSKAAQVIASSVSRFKHHVAAVCFGHKQAADRTIAMVANGQSASIVQSSHGRRPTNFKTSIKYGTLSAVHGQATGLASMVSSNGNSQVLHIVSMNRLDDAGMCVQDPASKADRAAGRRTEGRKIGDRLWKRGSNIFLPVCNKCEQIMVRREHNQGHLLSAAEIHTPSTVLCKANTGTIHRNWSKWTAIDVCGSGASIDPDRVLADVLQGSDAWKTIVCNKDNLALNRLIIGITEDKILSQLKAGLSDSCSSPSLLQLSCMGHSAVLSTKPVLDALDGLPSKWVRMGHLHESGKTIADHLEIIRDHVKSKFDFVPVSEYPPDFPAWKNKAATILRLSRPALDLKPEDEEFVMNIDNGDWDAASWSHFCLGSSCMCGGDPAKALDLMLTAAELSCGTCAKTPLSYRWKGMEAFARKLYRGMRQHKLCLFSHLLLFPPEKTRRSVEALSALGGEDAAGHNNVTIGHKTQVRGGKTVESSVSSTVFA